MVSHTVREVLENFRSHKTYVGFSGGADSVSLLLVVNEFALELGLELTAVHFDHGIRGEASRLMLNGVGSSVDTAKSTTSNTNFILWMNAEKVKILRLSRGVYALLNGASLFKDRKIVLYCLDITLMTV